MSRNFACGCSDESVAEAESWMREVFPMMEEGYGDIRTGKTKTLSYTDPTTKEKVEKEYPERREMDLTEAMLLSLEEEGNKRHRTYTVSIGSDQWCGLSVRGKPWDCDQRSKYHGREHPEEREETSYGGQYDYGLLPWLLARVILDIREEEPIVEEPEDG